MFKWPSIQRWQCLISNGALINTFTADQKRFWLKTCFIFLWESPLLNKKCASQFCRKNRKWEKTVHNSYFNRKRFQGYRCKSVAIFARRELEITLTVHLAKSVCSVNVCCENDSVSESEYCDKDEPSKQVSSSYISIKWRRLFTRLSISIDIDKNRNKKKLSINS